MVLTTRLPLLVPNLRSSVIDLFVSTFDRVIKTMSVVMFNKHGLTDIIMAGESTRIPQISSLLSALYFNGMKLE